MPESDSAGEPEMKLSNIGLVAYHAGHAPFLAILAISLAV